MFDFGDLSDAESDEGFEPEEVQQQRKPDASIRFSPGDVVKGRFQKGCWYLATILSENPDGRYTICWKDGDDHDTVKSSGELIYIRQGDSKSASWSAKARRAAERACNDAKKTQETAKKQQAQQPVDSEEKKWSDWDAQQKRFRESLEERGRKEEREKEMKEEREDQLWLEERMARLQSELREIDRLPPGVKKGRLRKLQLELHPDKQPERIRAKAQQLFLLVQGKWEANEATFQQAKEKSEEERQRNERAREAERRERRERERIEREMKEMKEKMEREKEQREQREREKEAEERRRAESRAKLAEQELKRFKEAAAQRRAAALRKQEAQRAGAQSSPDSQVDSPVISGPSQKENAPPNKEGLIHIRLRINGLNSQRPTFSTKSNATVASIRESVEELTGIPLSLQKIYAGDRELFDFETLKPLVKGNCLDLDVAEVPKKGGALAERIRKNWRMLQHAGEEMRSDKELVLEAVKQDSEALKFASESLRNDREIVFCAVCQDGLALEHASRQLQSDREIILAAVKKTWRALRYATVDLTADSEIGHIAVQQDWRALQYLSLELRDNKELLEVAIQQSGLALRFASKRLQKDHNTVLAAVRQNGNALAHAAVELRTDRQFVLAAVWKNGAALRYVDPDLRADKEVALAAVSGWD